jgi:hypothetical protein
MNRLFVLLMFVSAVGFAQVKVSPHSKLMFPGTRTGFISELPPAPPATVGSVFYSDEWQTADLFLKGDTKLENIQLKLDLSRQSFEVLHEGKVKLLPGDRVLSFHWINSKGEQEAFIRADHITAEGLKVSGFLKLHTDTEPFKLVEYFTTETLSSNYNAALDVGSKNNQIIRKSQLFIVKDKLMLEVKGTRKKFIVDFKNTFQTDVSGIIKEFGIDIRDDEELIVLLNQLNYSNPG